MLKAAGLHTRGELVSQKKAIMTHQRTLHIISKNHKRSRTKGEILVAHRLLKMFKVPPKM